MCVKNSMLSATSGYTKRSRVLGTHRDVATLRTTLCPALRMGGSCRAHLSEEKIRARIAAEKEGQLLRTATEVHTLQVEVLQGCDAAVDGDDNNNNKQRSASIASIVEELKCEPAYVNWSLDAAVAEFMASMGLRRCAYSHQLEMHTTLHRWRGRDEAKVGASQEPKGRRKSARMASERDTFARVERQRVFATLTPMQKCVVCLLWQGSFEVPRKVVCDVRGCMLADGLADGDVCHADVEAEERRIVTVTAHRPSLGVVDLSSLPHIVTYVSQHPNESVIHAETVAHFAASDNGAGNKHGIIPRGVTEKQIDISSPTCAHQLVEAIVWIMRLMNDNEASLYKHQNRIPVVLRSLALRRCSITSADAVINALRKHHLDAALLALDMSDNRLMNLRFLFTLRAHFVDRLLRLSLSNNPITRKPEYREQVRKSLPKLTSLDGTAIRRPPLCMPHPTELSYTFCAASPEPHSRRVISCRELDVVMDSLARFMYIWETRRIPWTALEEEEEEEMKGKRQRQAKERLKAGTEDTHDVLQVPEEDLDDDNFHHRYLHPSSTFSMSLQEGLTFFKPDVMRLATDVELDDSYVGMRLSPVDLRDLRLFDVAMKSSSRDLLLGRSVLHRFARGSLNCYMAYKCSVYPLRLEVCHHLGGAVVSVAKITDTVAPKPPSQEQQGDQKKQLQKRLRGQVDCPSATAAIKTTNMPFSGCGNNARKPAFYIVTMHGVMTWRTPSMRRSECVLAAYDRVMTFVENALPPTNPIEKRRSAPLLLFNDQLHLRPATAAPPACFRAVTEERVARLVVEYGLEACADGLQLVRAVVERSSSDAAAYATLQLLVFGSDGEAGQSVGLPPCANGDDKDDVNAAFRNEKEGDTLVARHFDIISIITAHDAVASSSDTDAVPVTVPHRVTLAQVDATVALMNSRCTAAFTSSQCKHERRSQWEEREVVVRGRRKWGVQAWRESDAWTTKVG